MICPYCSTDMEPIELSGKVFCSNCGLTIKNNQPAQKANTVSQQFQKVEDVATDIPEEVQFPVVPEVVEALEQKAENGPDTLIPSADEMSPTQDIPAVNTVTETLNPITQEAAMDLGIEPTSAPTAVDFATPPEAESRIADIGIPSETDFEISETLDATPQKSYLELTNPGNEIDALNASGILLDILGDDSKPELPKQHDKKTRVPKEPRKLKVDVMKDLPQNPVEHPEIEAVAEVTPAETDPIIDPKTEKQIEKIEKKIEDIPEPVVELTPEEAVKYDPDTLKSQAIKEYFSSALSESRNKPAKQAKKPAAAHSTSSGSTKKPKKKLKEHGPALIFAITLACVTALMLGGIIYYLITNFAGL